MILLRRLGSALILAMLASAAVGAADNARPWTPSDLMTAAQLNSQLPAVKGGEDRPDSGRLPHDVQDGTHSRIAIRGRRCQSGGLGGVEEACRQSSPQSGDRHLLRMLSVGRLPQHPPRLSSPEGNGILQPQSARHPRKARQRLDRERFPHCEGRVALTAGATKGAGGHLVQRNRDGMGAGRVYLVDSVRSSAAVSSFLNLPFRSICFDADENRNGQLTHALPS